LLNPYVNNIRVFVSDCKGSSQSLNYSIGVKLAWFLGIPTGDREVSCILGILLVCLSVDKYEDLAAVAVNRAAKPSSVCRVGASAGEILSDRHLCQY
jgi:hypothetical protein